MQSLIENIQIMWYTYDTYLYILVNEYFPLERCQKYQCMITSTIWYNVLLWHHRCVYETKLIVLVSAIALHILVYWCIYNIILPIACLISQQLNINYTLLHHSQGHLRWYYDAVMFKIESLFYIFIFHMNLHFKY